MGVIGNGAPLANIAGSQGSTLNRVNNMDPLGNLFFGAPSDPAPTATPYIDQAIDPNSNSIGGRLGISSYNGVQLPQYANPYDVQGFENSKYYQLANSNSESPWSKLANEQQINLASQQNATAKAQANGAAATSASRLAAQGGLTSGARERIQEGAGRNSLSMVQGNNQTAGNNIANIGIDDAKQRTAMLGDATNKLTSMQAANTQGQNTYNQTITQLLNQAQGANNSSVDQTNLANTTNYNNTHGGLFGGGGFLGLG